VNEVQGSRAWGDRACRIAVRGLSCGEWFCVDYFIEEALREVRDMPEAAFQAKVPGAYPEVCGWPPRAHGGGHSGGHGRDAQGLQAEETRYHVRG
jgi:hypothetical protein